LVAPTKGVGSQIGKRRGGKWWGSKDRITQSHKRIKKKARETFTTKSRARSAKVRGCAGPARGKIKKTIQQVTKKGARTKIRTPQKGKDKKTKHNTLRDLQGIGPWARAKTTTGLAADPKKDESQPKLEGT